MTTLSLSLPTMGWAAPVAISILKRVFLLNFSANSFKMVLCTDESESYFFKEGLFNQFSFWWLVNLGTASAWSLTGVIPPSITAPSGRKKFANGLFKRKKTHTKETTRRWSRIWKLHMLSISLRVLAIKGFEGILVCTGRKTSGRCEIWAKKNWFRKTNWFL